jgi:hypothetical protein
MDRTACCGGHTEKSNAPLSHRVSGVVSAGGIVGAPASDLRPAARLQNGLLALPAAGFTLTPFWLGYAIALAICVGWAWRLSREAKQRDAETTEREASHV